MALYVAVDRGRVSCHLVDSRRMVALCGLEVPRGADPVPDGEGRVTCSSCARLARYVRQWRTS